MIIRATRVVLQIGVKKGIKKGKILQEIDSSSFSALLFSQNEQNFEKHQNWAFSSSILDIFEDCSILAEK